VHDFDQISKISRFIENPRRVPSFLQKAVILQTAVKPGLKPRLWALKISSPAQSPHEAHYWAGLGQAQTGLAWLGFGL